MKKIAHLFLFVLIFSAGTVFAQEFTSTNFKSVDPVIAPAGYSTSATFRMWSTISEVAVGTSTSATFGLNAGSLFFPFASTPTVSATAGDGQAALSWTASTGFLGWTASGYDVGQSTTSGGPYSYSSLGNVTSSTRTGLSNGTAYYFVIIATDAFGNRIATSTETSATPASSGTGGGGGSGGGGGGGGGGSSQATGAVLSGRAYPGSTVTVLRDAVVIATSKIKEDARFSINASGLTGGTYLFSVYAEDVNGNQSSIITVPVSVTPGVTATVSGIFLAPTIDVDKTEVKKGNPIRVFGQSAPESTITISVNSEEELFFQTPTDEDGVYSFSFLTSPLELGSHSTRSNASKSGEISRASKTITFNVGIRDILKTGAKKPARRGDLNNDGKVNLVDFSIQAYWYKKKNFPLAYDLNSDSKIDLIDFSIMASNWTG